MSKQLTMNFSEEDANKSFGFTSVPFVDEVETFNATFNKPNNYEVTIPDKKEWQFVYDFVLEELEEYREACETGRHCGGFGRFVRHCLCFHWERYYVTWP